MSFDKNVTWQENDLFLSVEGNSLIIETKDDKQSKPFSKLHSSDIETIELTLGQNIILKTKDDSFTFKTGPRSKTNRKIIEGLEFEEVTDLPSRLYRFLNIIFAGLFVFFVLGIAFAAGLGSPQLVRFYIYYGVPISFVLYLSIRVSTGYALRKVASNNYADNEGLVNRVYRKKQ